MKIRNATREDLPEILRLFDIARAYMRASGHLNQWVGGYPGADIVLSDIQAGNQYVMEENSVIVGAFSLLPGEEPTYQYIENGHWHSENPYGTIHRLASRGTTPGIAKACFDFCLTKFCYLRVDTHEDNLPMQRAVTRYGFQKCGTIYLSDGAPRIAFDYAADSREEAFAVRS